VTLHTRLYASAREFLAAERPEVPGCIVLDVRLPEQSGLDFQRELTALDIRLPVIFITGHGDIPMSSRAFRAGAIEFLAKPFRDQELLDAVMVGIEKDRARLEKAQSAAELQKRFASLTAREREVMHHIASGKPNKQIAAALRLSEVTVKVHRGNVMRKMRANSLADLVRMADEISAVNERS
jgi:FixJ family two-component response regulator